MTDERTRPHGAPSMFLCVTAFDGQWAAEVCAYCDPVFDAANVGFVPVPLTQANDLQDG